MKSKQLISNFKHGKNKTSKVQCASSEYKRVKVAEADLPIHLSSGERIGPLASCYSCKII